MNTSRRILAAVAGVLLAFGVLLGLAATSSAAPPSGSAPTGSDAYPPGGVGNPSTPPVTTGSSSSAPGRTGNLGGTISNVAPASGEVIRLIATGFRANEHASIDFHSDVVHLASATADANGTVDASVKVPANACGSHTITVTGLESGRVDSFPLTVQCAAGASDSSNGGSSNDGSSTSASSNGGSNSGGLAYTGAAVVGMGALAVVLLAGGTAMVLIGRRPKATS